MAKCRSLVSFFFLSQKFTLLNVLEGRLHSHYPWTVRCVYSFFFFFCIVVWGQSCIFAHCGNTIRCDSYSSVVSQSNHIESFHVNYLFGALFFLLFYLFLWTTRPFGSAARGSVVAGSHTFFFLAERSSGFIYMCIMNIYSKYFKSVVSLWGVKRNWSPV